MDTVVYDRIEDVLGRIESLYGRVEDTYLVAKDILLGTQISDWIADLKASGTASATYSDASRMNALIANEDAANNVDVAKYLVQWAVANNKFGTYCGAACGAVSGVTWDSLTTPNAVMSNAAAFTALCGNSVAFKASMQNGSCKSAIYNNANVTEGVIRSSSTGMTVFRGLTQSFSISMSNNSREQNMFVLYVLADVQDTVVTLGYETGNHGTVNVPRDGRVDINRFANSISQTSPMALSVTYVDFS